MSVEDCDAAASVLRALDEAVELAASAIDLPEQERDMIGIRFFRDLDLALAQIMVETENRIQRARERARKARA